MNAVKTISTHDYAIIQRAPEYPGLRSDALELLRDSCNVMAAQVNTVTYTPSKNQKQKALLGHTLTVLTTGTNRTGDNQAPYPLSALPPKVHGRQASYLASSCSQGHVHTFHKSRRG